MRRLAQRLEEEGADPELRRYCERILRVRSTGWTQGIFANFAAESMVPKGPEWGGGNWEIKTPVNIKDIPQWALAAEVMPYMRTDDGTIPSIVTDHIGVYLGLIRGRGNVVEVREDSLVKAFKAESNDIKTNSLESVLATSIANKPKQVPEAESRNDSLMGLETLSKQSVASNAVDEQAKAEEEFKKSLYGSAADGSSSDEEDSSKAKKLRIRIRDKPVSSTTVDVNKIKEATKQLGLPISRTKSLTGSSPDLGLILPQPAPASTGGVTAPAISAPADLFGTDSFVQSTSVSQPASKVPGGGVTAGPIPEDFFQNTISSLQVAASLRPAGTYLSQMDANTQRSENNNAMLKQDVAVADIGLSDGGVPPQATQQPPLPESIGLPDGGIPPQAVSQPTTSMQSQVPTAQAPVPSQPLDLSSLEGAGSGSPGKIPERPASPKSVRPGQVSIWCLFISVRTKGIL